MLCAAAAGCRQASSALPQAVRQLAARPMLGSCCHLAVLLLLRQHSYPAGCTARPMLGPCCHLAVLLVLHQHSYPAGCTARPMLGPCCHLAVLLVLHQHNYPAGCTTVLASLLAGHLCCCFNQLLF